MTAATIDLNADLGEDPAREGRDLELMNIVSSANIACGGHAGDEASMLAMITAAAARGVGVGAHPSYPDRIGFGRVETAMAIEELEASVAGQIAVFVRIARAVGVPIAHVKPHGALYHAAMERDDVAGVLARAARAAGPGVPLVGLAGSPRLARWRSMGIPVIAEAFADRRYTADGTLLARSAPGAVITDPAEAGAQAVSIAREGVVFAPGGERVEVRAASVCVHSDTPGALDVARAVRRALECAGVAIAPCVARS